MTTAEVITTQQVVITETAIDVLELTTSTAPAVVQVVAQGPQGPQALASAIRIDATTAGTVYVGSAVNGSSESAAVWTITRSTYNAAGVGLTKQTATGVSWTGRTGHTYS